MLYRFGEYAILYLVRKMCGQELEPDALRENLCNDCSLCVKACPVGALEERELRQQTCWDHAFGYPD